MIHIIKKSKKSSKRQTINLPFNEAVIYLYDLNVFTFRVYNVMVYCGDNTDAFIKLKGMFNDNFLIYKKDDQVDIYIVNESTPKNERLAYNEGATVKSISNFIDKLKLAMPFKDIDLIFNRDNFVVNIVEDKMKVKIVFNYFLESENIYAVGEEPDHPVDTEELDFITQTINEIFRNQRYYYRNAQCQDEKVV